MTAALKDVLDGLVEGNSLSEDHACELMLAFTDAGMNPAMAGALLAALRAKGPTPAEVRGFARGMRSLARQPALPPGLPVADLVGTGGDASHSYNLSTGAALLAAAAGVPIAKHGNRSVSSNSGSADVLERLGLPMPLDEQQAGRCLEATGFTFLFAPHYHPAMKAIAPIRAAMGVRTIFNLLGPLTNPAGTRFGVVGAWSMSIARLMAETLAGMEIERVLVLHGDNGWDEPTPVAPFTLLTVTPGSVTESRRSAGDYGLPACTEADLRGGDAAHNAAALAAVLRGEETGAHRDALLMGAALLLEATGRVADPSEAALAAAAAIDDGRAARTLDALIAFGASVRG
ncbi:MAG: anthranilate phosphoribosyltransferase [Steroidobacteraceae bacterium]